MTTPTARPLPMPPNGPDVRDFVARSRRAVLATIDGKGHPRLVPICYVLSDPPAPASAGPEVALVLYSAIDEKPKRTGDPLRLARVRDLLARPVASVLVDRWSEDWDRLAWLRLACRAKIISADASARGEHARAVAGLRAKYPQYRTQRLESRPLIRLTCTVWASWGALDEGDEEES